MPYPLFDGDQGTRGGEEFIVYGEGVGAVRTVFFLVLFSIVILLLPRSTRTEIQIIAGKAASAVHSASNIVRSRSSSVGFPVGVGGTGYRGQVCTIAIHMDFCSPGKIVPGDAAFSVSKVGIIGLDASGCAPLTCGRAFFVCSSGVRSNCLRFSFNGGGYPMPMSYSCRIAVGRTIPRVFVAGGGCLGRDVQAKGAASVKVRVSSSCMGAVDGSGFGIASSGDSILGMRDVARSSGGHDHFAIALGTLGTKSTGVALSCPGTATCGLAKGMASPSGAMTAFHTSGAALGINSGIDVHSLVGLGNNADLAVGGTGSDGPSMLTVSKGCLIPGGGKSTAIATGLGNIGHGVAVAMSTPTTGPAIGGLGVDITNVGCNPGSVGACCALGFAGASTGAVAATGMRVAANSNVCSRVC